MRFTRKKDHFDDGFHAFLWSVSPSIFSALISSYSLSNNNYFVSQRRLVC